MACQSCLDKRRALLGAIGMSKLQAKVPVTVREILYRELVSFVPAKAYPVNVQTPNMLFVRHVLDVAIPSKRIGVDVGYQKLSPSRQAARDLELRGAGWVMFTFTPEYLEQHMAEAVSSVKRFL